MAKKEPVCPLLKKACLGHDCAWYAHMEGMNPQNGAVMDHWDCAIKWLPILITEQARQTRGVQASVESMRNETVTRQDQANSHMAEMTGQMAGVMPIVHMISAVATQKLPPASPVEYLSNDKG